MQGAKPNKIVIQDVVENDMVKLTRSHKLLNDDTVKSSFANITIIFT